MPREVWPSLDVLADSDDDGSELKCKGRPADSTTAGGNCTSGNAHKQSMGVDLTDDKTAKNNCDDSQRANTVSCWDGCWEYNWYVLPQQLLTYCHLLQL